MKARMKIPTATMIATVLALLLFYVSSVEAVEVDIPDPGLEAAIRDELGIGPDEQITDADLASIKHLPAMNREITDLTGLEYCVKMEGLHLNSNNIRDISPLSGLTSLWRLQLHDNNIRDINPLSGLTNLEYLYLSSNSIRDIIALSGLTNLLQLYLEGNNISDLGPLSGLTDLRHLGTSYNKISDFSPLSGLTKLEHLYLDDNNINDLSGLIVLTNLRSLDLRDNNIRDIGALSEWTNLLYLYLSHNSISDISPLSGLTNLVVLRLEDNNISDIQPLVDNSGLATNDWVDLRSNPLSDKAISTDIPILQDRGVDVSFQTPIEMNLIAVIESWDLSGGTENSLIARLRSADRASIEGDWQTMVEHVNAFINQCERMRGTKLTEDQADYLIAEALYIIEF